MRTYRKFSNVQDELRNLILALRSSGETRLDGERDLAVRLGAGRATIGKALKRLEQERLICCSKGGVSIVPFQQRFRYAYVATVHFINNTFWFLAYQHLWNELEKQTRRQGIQIELVLFDPDQQKDSIPQFLEQLAQYDLVFLSLLGGFFKLRLSELMLKMNRNIILLDENMGTDGFPLYCLDNFETGEFAARLLLERGYRRTALLAPCINTSSIDFRSRVNGFTSTMEKNGGSFELYATNVRATMEELNLMQRCICLLPRLGFDSIFYLDDKWVAMSDPLIESGNVPDFGILAFDGTMSARVHNPPIDTISHATIPLAEKICKIIMNWEIGRFQYDPAVRYRIPPNFFRGRTLRELPK